MKSQDMLQNQHSPPPSYAVTVPTTERFLWVIAVVVVGVSGYLNKKSKNIKEVKTD